MTGTAIDVGKLSGAFMRQMKRAAWLNMARGMRIAGADYPAVCAQLAKEQCDAKTTETICDAIYDCEYEDRRRAQ